MRRKLPSEAECKRASSLLNDVLGPAFQYAERKRHVARPFSRYRETQEWWDGFPDNWEEIVLGMLAAGSVFTRPDRVAAFLRGTKTSLRDELAAIVRRWRARPWIWTFFRVVEDLGDRRLLVAPVGARPSAWGDAEEWETLLVYSRSVADDYRRGHGLTFGLLVDMGPAFVTYGALLPFRGLEDADALFMAHVVSNAGSSPASVPLLGVADRTMPVSDIAARDPFPFLAMLRVSETPPVRTPKGPPGRYASWVDLPEETDAWSEPAWRASAAAAGEELAGAVFDETGAGITFGEGSPMYDPMIYLSRDRDRAFLEARTRAGYDRGRRAAERIVRFPDKPDVDASIIALTAASHILGLDDTLRDECGMLRLRYEDKLVGSGLPEDVSEDAIQGALPSGIDEFQAIADRLVHNHNEGVREDDETIGTALGVNPEVVANVRRQLEGALSRIAQPGDDAPEADRFGLSPSAFAKLARPDAPAADGVFRLRKPNELRNAQSLMTNAPSLFAVSWLLEQALSDEGLPATKAGYISPRIVNRAHEVRILESPVDTLTPPQGLEHSESWQEIVERVRPKKETDWLRLLRVRRLAESADLLRLSANRFTATDTAVRLVDDPAALYHHLLTTAFRTFDWAEHPRFEPDPALHSMAGFLFYAAGELSDARSGDEGWATVRSLTDRFIAAVPPIAEAVRAERRSSTPGMGSFDLRRWLAMLVDLFFVECLGRGFFLLEQDNHSLEDAMFRTTSLYDAVFERAG
ncbi:MAG: hypothetical protein ACOCU9_01860 [Spirochaetota bacterium]